MRPVGKGSPSRGQNPGESRRIMISFDLETFEEIRARALKEHTGFATQVRLLCEWGLMEAAHELR